MLLKVTCICNVYLSIGRFLDLSCNQETKCQPARSNMYSPPIIRSFASHVGAGSIIDLVLVCVC